MSVLDQIRKLDEQKASLLKAAKQEALTKANEALAELRTLGYQYELIERSGSVSEVRSGGRRTGIREQVLQTVKNTDGITRADLLETMGAKGDKSAEQSISNALASLKKLGTISQEGNRYKA